jgi:hypothetical protein
MAMLSSNSRPQWCASCHRYSYGPNFSHTALGRHVIELV